CHRCRDLRTLPSFPTRRSSDLTKPLESYVAVSQGAALNVLNRAGLPVQELHAHADHTFSAIFSALQALSFEELIGRLSEAGDIIDRKSTRLNSSHVKSRMPSSA